MQTFLPYTDFLKSAQCLDYKRLGKQRVEAKQILNILLGETDKPGWRNHPAVLMWKGYEDALMQYYNTISKEWISRGYKHNMGFAHWSGFHGQAIEIPVWLTDEFCSYHRATLLFKNSEWYSQFGWTEEPKYEYLWPVKKSIAKQIFNKQNMKKVFQQIYEEI